MLLVTSLVTVLGFLYPPVLEALRREAGALAAGEWWRLATPLLVHDGGWPQFGLNATALVVVGSAVERAVGLARWLVLYAAGGLAGEVAGYAWQPVGAGNSVAVFGLMGGLAVLLLSGSGMPLFPCLAALYTGSPPWSASVRADWWRAWSPV